MSLESGKQQNNLKISEYWLGEFYNEFYPQGVPTAELQEVKLHFLPQRRKDAKSSLTRLTGFTGLGHPKLDLGSINKAYSHKSAC